MVCMCSDKQEIVLELFQQIEKSISLLQQWNKDIKTVDDYLLSPEGMKKMLNLSFKQAVSKILCK